MTPADFPQSMRMLGDNGYRSEVVAAIAGLPVWTDGEMCVSCWKMSWRERLSALLHGTVWVSVLSGSNQPPIAIQAARAYFVEPEPDRCSGSTNP